MFFRVFSVYVIPFHHHNFWRLFSKVFIFCLSISNDSFIVYSFRTLIFRRLYKKSHFRTMFWNSRKLLPLKMIRYQNNVGFWNENSFCDVFCDTVSKTTCPVNYLCNCLHFSENTDNLLSELFLKPLPGQFFVINPFSENTKMIFWNSRKLFPLKIRYKNNLGFQNKKTVSVKYSAATFSKNNMSYELIFAACSD